MRTQTKSMALAHQIFAHWILLILITMALSSAVQAQSNETGTIHGIVSDSSGAIIPGASATLTGANLVVPRTTTSDDRGRYQFEQVPVGTYILKFTIS